MSLGFFDLSCKRYNSKFVDICRHNSTIKYFGGQNILYIKTIMSCSH